MAVERQSLGQQMQQVRRVAPSGRTVNTAYQTSSVEVGADRGVQILNSVLNASGQALSAAGQRYKERIEDDKVRQMNRALRMLSPSDDSTQAGYVAHGLVGVQNGVLESTKRLEELAKTFTGTNEEWDDVLASERQSIQDTAFSNYPALTDPEQRQQFLSVITNAFLEQAPRLTAARESAKIEQERQARLSTFETNLLQRMSGETPNFNRDMSALMNENSKALRLTQTEVDTVLINAAVTAAQSGDSRLVEYSKQHGGDVSLFARSGKLQQAEKTAQRVWSAENAGAVAMAKDELNTQFQSGDLQWPEFLAAAEDLNAKTGNTAYTDDSLLALKNQRQRSIASKVDINGYLKQGDLAGKGGGKPVGLSVQDPKTKDMIVDAVVDKFSLIEQSIINNSPELADNPQALRQLANKTNARIAEWLTTNQLTNKGWKEQFDTVLNYNLDNVEADTSLPTNLADVLELWQTLPAGSKVEHASPQAAAMLSNFEDFRAQGKGDIQALSLAQKAVRSNRTFSSKELKNIESAASSAADDLTSGSWLPFDSAPSWYEDLMAQNLKQAILTNMKAGYVSIDKAATDAKAAFEKHYTTLDNGQLVFGNRQALAGEMAVSPDDIELTLDTYLEMNKEQLLDRAGGANLDELYYDVIPGRGIAYVRSGINGMPVSAPIVLSEIKVGRDEYLATRKAEKAQATQDIVSGVTGSVQSEVITGEVQPVEPDGWTGAARLDGRMPIQEAMLPEATAAFEQAMKQAENSVKAGFDKKTGTWTPHKSLEGGTDTLGYGHKLTKAEVKRGYIDIDGTSYKFTDGDSEITEEVATALLRQDMAKSEKQLASSWEGFDKLPVKYKKVLINIQYNTGKANQATWPKLKEAMDKGDDAAVRNEMITSYRDSDGNKDILSERATMMADILGL